MLFYTSGLPVFLNMGKDLNQEGIDFFSPDMENCKAQYNEQVSTLAKDIVK